MLGSKERVATILGLGLREKRKRLFDVVRAGLPASAFDSVAAYTKLTDEALAAATAIPLRTVQRRKSSRERRLARDESDRLARIARLYAFAEGVLGSREAAETWMRTANYTLDNVRPIDMLDTEIAAREVEDVLGRIDDGVFA